MMNDNEYDYSPFQVDKDEHNLRFLLDSMDRIKNSRATRKVLKRIQLYTPSHLYITNNFETFQVFRKLNNNRYNSQYLSLIHI